MSVSSVASAASTLARGLRGWLAAASAALRMSGGSSSRVLAWLRVQGPAAGGTGFSISVVAGRAFGGGGHGFGGGLPGGNRGAVHVGAQAQVVQHALWVRRTWAEAALWCSEYLGQFGSFAGRIRQAERAGAFPDGKRSGLLSW
ncbi:MAG: hypothetical protein HS108_12475 [Planctomycetes bacterium]|nr:hypothetical protein [Planctomycetota bacterium]